MSDNGYVLRIASAQWVTQVFETTIYYTNMQRRWIEGQTVLFLYKTNAGDAFVGYGKIRKTWRREDLVGQDKSLCEKGGWKTAIEFTYVKQFDQPLLIKNTPLKASKLKGRYFHGLKLNKNQIEAILIGTEL